MTLINKDSTIESIIELLGAHGLDGMGQAMAALLNEAMKIERTKFLQAEPYERTEGRQDYANGYKPKQVKTRVGALSLAIPQVRSSEFYPSVLERGMRSERALRVSLAEMYLQGVSTRKVKEITEQLCGFEVSSTQVSQASQLLDKELEAWRTRALGKMDYLFFDARYEKVREGGCVTNCAVLIAYGIDEEGKRHVLGVSVSLSEQEVHWRQFMESLVSRGLYGVKLITSDAHSGLKAAKQAVFPSVPWQRCQFHLQQNAQAYVPKKEMKSAVARDIRAIFNAPDEKEAMRFLNIYAEKYQATAPRLSQWMQENLHEGLTVMSFPEPHRKQLRTSNLAERVNQTIRARTRVARLFPNTASCLRLVSAILVEIDEEWQSAKTYLPVIQE
jgi:putative transposase